MAKDLRLEDGTVVDPLVTSILERRNVIGREAVLRFLQPKLNELPDPYLMKDMAIAVDRIVSAVHNGEPIVIVGDYDVDGTTGTALLLRFFNEIGVNVDFYIPNRLTEGYGLQESVVRKISSGLSVDEGMLLITVDNGISAGTAIDTANELGVSTIVTDHHTPPKERVAAEAVINPKQLDCQFPYKELAGVGVAFFLVVALRTNSCK